MPVLRINVIPNTGIPFGDRPILPASTAFLSMLPHLSLPPGPSPASASPISPGTPDNPVEWKLLILNWLRKTPCRKKGRAFLLMRCVSIIYISRCGIQLYPFFGVSVPVFGTPGKGGVVKAGRLPEGCRWQGRTCKCFDCRPRHNND